jgi:hypothetical protein
MSLNRCLSRKKEILKKTQCDVRIMSLESYIFHSLAWVELFTGREANNYWNILKSPKYIYFWINLFYAAHQITYTVVNISILYTNSQIVSVWLKYVWFVCLEKNYDKGALVKIFDEKHWINMNTTPNYSIVIFCVFKLFLVLISYTIRIVSICSTKSSLIAGVFFL